MDQTGELPSISNVNEVQPKFLSSELIAKLNEQGFRFRDQTIRMIDECRDALEGMPTGARGVVIGSGSETAKWHQRGWETLDIDEKYGSTYTADANNLANVLGEGTCDYILAEYITMHSEMGYPTVHKGKNGDYILPALGHENLLIQAALALKPKGRLILQGADFADAEFSDYPKSEKYADLMGKHGFVAALEIHSIQDFNDLNTRRVKGVGITWYAEKNS